MSLKLTILTRKITESKKQLNYICLNGRGSSYGTLQWFEKEKDCQTQIKRNTIFPLVHLDLTPLQSCLLRLQEMSCRAAALPLVPSPLPSSARQRSASVADPQLHPQPTLVFLDFVPIFFTSWLIGVKSLLTFLAIGSLFPPPHHPFVTILALRICKDATRLRKSLKHKLLNPAVCLPFSYSLC